MTPNKDQNINLLPADLQRKRAVIKNLVAEKRIEYTDPKNGASKTSVNMLAGKAKGPKKDGFLSRLFRRPAPKASSSVAGVLPLPVVVQKIKPVPLPAPVVDLKSIAAARLAAREPEPPEYTVPKNGASATKVNMLSGKTNNKKKDGFLSRLFRRRPSAPPAVAPAPSPPPAPVPLKVPPLPTPQNVAAVSKPVAPPPVKPVSAPPPESVAPKSAAPAFGVNLLHEEYAQAFHHKNQKGVFLGAVGSTFLLIILAYASLHLYQVRSAASARAASVVNQKLEATIASYSDLDKNDKALAKKVLALKSLLEKHISLKAFLEKLEAATIAEVTYLSIAASKEGGVTITALAKDYTALARQITVFQEATPWVRSATVASATLSRDTQGQVQGIGFDITLLVDPAVFTVLK